MGARERCEYERASHRAPSPDGISEDGIGEDVAEIPGAFPRVPALEERLDYDVRREL